MNTNRIVRKSSRNKCCRNEHEIALKHKQFEHAIRIKKLGNNRISYNLLPMDESSLMLHNKCKVGQLQAENHNERIKNISDFNYSNCPSTSSPSDKKN